MWRGSHLAKVPYIIGDAYLSLKLSWFTRYIWTGAGGK